MPKSKTAVAASRARNTNGSDRRDELLGIAAELFATRGYARTTVRDIADEAGILSGSLYHHFASKEAMLDEILRSFLENLHNTFARIDKENKGPRAALDQFIDVSLRAIHSQAAAVALYQNESVLLREMPGFEFVEETSRRIERIWQNVLRRGSEDGTFRRDLDPALTHRFVRDALWSTVTWYKPGGRYSIGTIAEQFRSFVYGGILAE